MKCLSIDVGGTFIKYGVVEKMKLGSKGKRPTPENDRKQFLRSLEEIYRSYQDADCVSISIPGRVDTIQGTVLTGGALGYIAGLPLRRQLKQQIPVPVYLENDANCAAAAELQAGSLKGCENALVYLIGTGIGGGVVINGKIYKGSHNFAGEFSYLNVSYGQLKQDKLSHFCGVPALLQMAAAKNQNGAEIITGDQFFKEIKRGNPVMLEILDEYTRRIAVSLYSLQCLYDVEKIAIGGGVSAQPILLEYIEKNTAMLYQSIHEPLPRAEIVRCQFENDANLLGAAYTALGKHGKER